MYFGWIWLFIRDIYDQKVGMKWKKSGGTCQFCPSFFYTSFGWDFVIFFILLSRVSGLKMWNYSSDLWHTILFKTLVTFILSPSVLGLASCGASCCSVTIWSCCGLDVHQTHGDHRRPLWLWLPHQSPPSHSILRRWVEMTVYPVHAPYRPYAWTSSSRRVGGKGHCFVRIVIRDWHISDNCVSRNPIDPQGRAPWDYDVICIRSIRPLWPDPILTLVCPTDNFVKINNFRPALH